MTIRGFQTNTVRGNGILKTDIRNVSEYTSINIFGSYELEIVSQQKPFLQISGDENILPLIKTEVQGKALSIYVQPNTNIAPKIKLKVQTSSYYIEQIASQGANKLKIDRLNNQNFNLSQNGTGKTEILGKTKRFYLNLNGATKVNAIKFCSQQATVKLLGTAHIDTYTTEDLKIEIMGIGSVNYYGNPRRINKSVLGLGSVRQMF
jgi:hypothetical protein